MEFAQHDRYQAARTSPCDHVEQVSGSDRLPTKYAIYTAEYILEDEQSGETSNTSSVYF